MGGGGGYESTKSDRQQKLWAVCFLWLVMAVRKEHQVADRSTHTGSRREEQRFPLWLCVSPDWLVPAEEVWRTSQFLQGGRGGGLIAGVVVCCDIPYSTLVPAPTSIAERPLPCIISQHFFMSQSLFAFMYTPLPAARTACSDLLPATSIHYLEVCRTTCMHF